MKFIVAGFSNCGTHSLVSYLRYCGFEAEHDDFLYKKDHREKRWDLIFADARPIFITRENIQDFSISGRRLVGGKPLSNYDFDSCLEKFADYFPIVVRLEDMTKITTFPFLNAQTETKKAKPELWERQKNLNNRVRQKSKN